MRVFGLVGEKRGRTNSKRLLQALNGDLSQEIVTFLVSGAPDGVVEQEVKYVAYAFRTHLCELVDGWIATGKSGEDERPWQRVASSPLPYGYIERNPPALLFDEEGPYLVLLPRWRRTGRCLTEAISDGAVAMFLQLLDSPSRFRLSKCEGCRTYFMRIRAPKKGAPIFHGSWCKKCKNKGSIKRVKDSRDLRIQRMVKWAAHASLQWKPSRRHGEWALWVVRKVNDQLPAGWNQITKNWVTRHKSEIDAEVERRKHAKG